MRRASDMFNLVLIQDHAPNDFNAIAIKAHPNLWHKDLMDTLDPKYKIISEFGKLDEQKLALRSAALDSVDMLVLYNIILEQEEADLIYIGKIFVEDVVGFKNVMKYFMDLRTLSHYSTLSYLTISAYLGDKGDWIDAYKQSSELANKILIRGILNEDPVTQNLAAMAKHASDERKMLIINSKYDYLKIHLNPI